MGNAIKKVANCTLSFFRKVKDLICDASKKVIEVIVNGVKTIVSYFKKVLVYVWNKIKIVAKLLYYGGKQAIQVLTNKEGIIYLIQYFNDLINKKVQVRDMNNNIIVPQFYFGNIFNQANQNDQIKVNAHIISNRNEREEEETTRDFIEKDELSEIPGFKQNDSVACTKDREITFDDISSTNTNYSWNSKISNYSNYSNYSNNRFRQYY